MAKRKKKDVCDITKSDHVWESDGNGVRFCTACKMDHPSDADKQPDVVARLHQLVAQIDAVRLGMDEIVKFVDADWMPYWSQGLKNLDLTRIMLAAVARKLT